MSVSLDGFGSSVRIEASPCGKSLDMTESAALPGINDQGHVAFNSAAECRSPHNRQVRSKTPSYLCLPKQISQSELLSNLEFVVKQLV